MNRDENFVNDKIRQHYTNTSTKLIVDNKEGLEVTIKLERLTTSLNKVSLLKLKILRLQWFYLYKLIHKIKIHYNHLEWSQACSKYKVTLF